MLAYAKIWHAYVVAVIVLFIVSLYFPFDSDIVPEGSKILDPAKATIDMLDGVIKLMVTLTTTMVGAAAALTIKGSSWSSRWTHIDSVVIVFVFLCAVVSYFGVYVSYMRILTMVGQAPVEKLGVEISLFDPALLRGLKLQYFSVITGYVCLGLVFTRMVEGRISKPS